MLENVCAAPVYTFTARFRRSTFTDVIEIARKKRLCHFLASISL